MIKFFSGMHLRTWWLSRDSRQFIPFGPVIHLGEISPRGTSICKKVYIYFFANTIGREQIKYYKTKEGLNT